MDKNPIIVSLGVGSIFPKLLNRLKKSCKHFGIDYWLWDTFPLNAKTHSQSPYGFKIHVIQHALQRGYKTIIWADSACYIIKDPSPFFQLVRDKGILFLGHGDKLSKYVNDRSLKLFGFEREEIKNRWLVTGSLFGFDFSNNRVSEFFNEWKNYEKEGWFKEDDQEPSENFLTHRHDEAIVSMMLAKYKIDTPDAYIYFQGKGEEEGVMFKAGKDIR